MRVSFNQLKNMVDFSYTPGQLAEKLTALGLEVREIEVVGQLKGVVVGRVLDVKKHPNADKLKIVEVDIGEKVVSFVCGAPNVEEGKYVAVALEGTELPGNVKVKKVKIRGVSSSGMICSERELCLGEDHSGIMILPFHLSAGDKLSHALSIEDNVLDLEITSNRGDCLSVLGIAREIAALTGNKLNSPFSLIKKEQLEFEKTLPDIQINNLDLCPFYAARIIKGIKVASSPFWLRWKILLSGGKPVNNVVDVTNYVMEEMGQPLHSFDLETITGSKVVIRRAKKEEVLVTLDGKERKLSEEMLIIADYKNPIALAGIMGGKETEVKRTTQNIFLEAAYFNSVSIGTTSRKLGLSSEASIRFERGVDPGMLKKALDRACMLIQQVAGGKILSPMLEAGKPPIKERQIYFRPSRINRIAGTRIPFTTSERILRNLGFKIKKSEDAWRISVPTFRQDVKREIDLVEEVCRVYGYNKIGASIPGLGVGGGRESRQEKVENLLREFLKGCGFYETKNNTLVGEELGRIACQPLDRISCVSNPLSMQQKFLRIRLFPRLLEVASFNYNKETKDVRILEIGKTFLKNGSELKESSFLSGVVVEDKFNFYHLKGIVEAIYNLIGIKEIRFCSYLLPYFSDQVSALIKREENNIGFLGKVHPEICNGLKLPLQTYVFELNLEFVVSLYNEQRQYRSLPRFPSIKRDLSIVIKEEILAEEIKRYILEKARYIEKVQFFDFYQGSHVPDGYKSLSFSLIFRHPDKTLTDDGVNIIQERIVKSLNNKWGASLRDK